MILDYVEARLWKWAEQVSRESDVALGYSTHSCYVRKAVGGQWDGVPDLYLEAADIERSVTALPAPLREALEARYLGEGELPKRTLYARVNKAHKILADMWGLE